MPSIIDRTRFLNEIAQNPDLISKLASMVRGEVGLGRDRVREIIQLETAFNRAQAREHSLGKALLSTGESKAGYYDPKTYRQAATPEQIKYFRENILNPVLAGSNEGERFLGKPPTGNASQMGFAGRRLASGQYAAGKWYGQPGGSEMFVLEAHDAPKIGRLGGGTEYAGLENVSNKVQFGPDGNPIWNPTTPAYGPQGTTLTSTPQQPPAPPTTAPAVEPTLANKVQTALFGQPGAATTPGQPAQSTPLMSGLEGLAGAFKPRVDPQAAAAAATLTPPSPTPTAGGTGNPAQAQALLAALLQNQRKQYGLSLTGMGGVG